MDTSFPEQYDAIIIGAGQSGIPLAHALAEAGWKTAIIERNYVGGTCVNYGCTPTKTMIASAQVAHLARRASDYGVHLGEVKIDLKQILLRKDAVVERFRNGIEKGMDKAENIHLIYGEALFTASRLIEIRLPDGEKKQLTADKIFINTGVSSQKPHFDGIERVKWLDSTAMLQLEELPEHLLIIGGSYISLEFGQMFRRFGCRVSIFERGEQLLKNEDADIAEEIKKILGEEGVNIYLHSNISNVAKNSLGQIELQLTTSGKAHTITGSHLLVAIGSTPNTAALNLEATNVEIDDKGYILVNDQLETTHQGVYAMGDVKGGPAFTHISYDDFRILKTNILEDHKVTITERQLPYTVFIDPQLGRIGLNEKQAMANGLQFKKATYQMRYVGRAIEIGQTKGLMKVIIDKTTDQVLGASILGVDGGEVMSMIQIAMMGKLSYKKLRDAIFAHPTLAESLNSLFNQVQ
jgi:pyruvate/2-oxoglutarate dehydrogenase complex dihydrolipoamide dehydrogenase (E3) component